MRWQLLAAVAVAAVAGTAQAQQPRQPGGGMRQQTPLYMTALTNEDLQKDLKITDDQKKSLKEVTDKATELNKKRAEAFGGGQPDREKMQEIQKEATALTEAAKTATDKTFTDEQKKRLKQIEVQRMGLQAFTNEDVVKAMKFTDDQKAKLKTLGEEYAKARGDLQKEYGLGGAPGGGGARPDAAKMAEYTKKSTALSTETMDKAKKELTDDQKKTWTDLTGAAFDLTKLQPARPARRDN
jgi:hypothetical protein